FERQASAIHADDDAERKQLRAALERSTIVVDALLGTGANRPIEGALKVILQVVRERKTADMLQVVAVDLPSGLNADGGSADPATMPADVTITLGYPKVGFYKFPAADALGELVVADISIPQGFAADIALNLATKADAARRLPQRPRDGHKGTFGKAMIVAGSNQ